MSVTDALLKNAYEDTQLLIKNDSLGDVFSIPRDVDFVLKCDDRKKAEIVASFILDNRYGLPSIGESDSGFRVVVTVNMPTTQNVLCSVSGLMACLSKLFDLDYDGWGCVVQHGESSDAIPT